MGTARGAEEATEAGGLGERGGAWDRDGRTSSHGAVSVQSHGLGSGVLGGSTPGGDVLGSIGPFHGTGACARTDHGTRDGHGGGSGAASGETDHTGEATKGSPEAHEGNGLTSTGGANSNGPTTARRRSGTRLSPPSGCGDSITRRDGAGAVEGNTVLNASRATAHAGHVRRG